MGSHHHDGAAWWAERSRRRPMLTAACIAVTCVLLGAWQPWAGIAAAVVAGGLGKAVGGWRIAAAWCLCGLLAAAVFIHREIRWVGANRTLMAMPAGELEAKLLEDARGTGRFWVAPARILSGPAAGEKVWWEGRGALPVSGSRVRARGNALALPEPRNPGEFNRADWMRKQGIAAVFHAAGFENLIETPPSARFGAAIRHGFRERITAGLEHDSQQARVIRAVVIGEPPPDSHSLISAFRLSGTLHVFCVSGLHVGMVGGIGWLLLGWAGVPRRWAVPALLPLVFGYAWITGNGAPAVRSAWMAAVFLGAFAFRRKPDLLNALGAVLLAATLWDGRLLFQPGVQLSYGVVAAIAIGASWAAKTFSWMTQPELHLPGREMSRWQMNWLRLRRHIAGSLAVSLAAGIGSAPLTTFHFGLFTPISVLASLALVPMVFALLATALFSVGLSIVAPPLSRGVNHLNGHLANACVVVADGFASLPGGHVIIRRQSQPALIVFDLDYGAAAACFTDGNGHGLLIDCGNRRTFKYQTAPSLRWLGIDPDSVVLSHPDGAHLGGGSQVWETFPIRQALMPVERSRSPTYRLWIEQAPRHGVRLHQARATTRMALPDGARLEVLHVPDPLAHNSLADDRVMVFRIHWKSWRILFTSDAGIGTENQLLRSGADLRSDVIIAGSHRSDLTLGDAFLDAVDPQVIIAANPRFPIEEKRRPETLAYWESRGIRVVDQAESGGVTIHPDENGKLNIHGFLGTPEWSLPPR